MDTNQWILISATFVVAITSAIAGLTIGKITSKAVDSISRQPEAGSRIQSVTLLGAALAEATAIYGLFAAIIMLLLRWD